MFWLYISIWLILFIIMYIRFDKERKVTFTDKYYENPPEGLPPAILSYLLKSKVIQRSDLSGTILSLIKQGFLLFDEEDKKISPNKDNTSDSSSLYEHEQYVLTWVESGHGDFSKWRTIVEKDSIEQGFFEVLKYPKIAGYIFGGLYMLSGIVFSYLFDKYAFLFGVFLGFVILRYIYGIEKPTRKGQVLYEKGMAFKRYLKDNPELNFAPYRVCFQLTNATQETKSLEDLSSYLPRPMFPL